MGRLGGVWFHLAASLAVARDVCLDSEDVVGHVSLLQTKAELLNNQVPGDVVSRIADQDLFGKHERLHPHRVQMHFRRAMRKARIARHSKDHSLPINDHRLLREIMSDMEDEDLQKGAVGEDSMWSTRRQNLMGDGQDNESSKDLISRKSTDLTDSADDSAFQIEGETKEQKRGEKRKEGRVRGDLKAPAAAGKPTFRSYRRDEASKCGDCGSANHLNVGLGGARFDEASQISAMDVCGPVCDSHAECGGFNFVESLGHCYYRRSTTCQKSSDIDRDCYTKGNSAASAEDKLLDAAGSDAIEAPQDEMEDEISQCRPYMESTGCGWTSQWNCPDQKSGSLGEAGISGGHDTLGFRCCCTHGLWAADTTVHLRRKDGGKTAAKHHVENDMMQTPRTKDFQAIKHAEKGIDVADAKLVSTTDKSKRASDFKRRGGVKHTNEDKDASKVDRRGEVNRAAIDEEASKAERREEVRHAGKEQKAPKVERREGVKHTVNDTKASKVERRVKVKHANKYVKAKRSQKVKHVDNKKASD